MSSSLLNGRDATSEIAEWRDCRIAEREVERAFVLPFLQSCNSAILQLLVSEGQNRIDAARAVRGDQTGSRRYQREQDQRRGGGERIARFNAVELRCDESP